MKNRPSYTQTPCAQVALKISLIYASFSLLWILLSDLALLSLSSDAEWLTQVQTLKAWFFVIASSLLIYFLLKKSTAVAQENQQEYLDIFDATSEALFIHDGNTGLIIDANQSAQTLFGYSHEELIQRTVDDLNISPDDSSATSYIKKTRNKHNEIIWIEISRQYFSNQNTEKVVSAVRNITRRRRSDEVLRTLAETGSLNNANAFKTIVRQLALSHDMRYAVIASLNPRDDNTATTLAVWNGSDFGENFTYSLMGTPCENVTSDGTCCYPEDIQQLFPHDELLVQMKAQSYLGTPLKNSLGETTGLLAILDDKPMSERPETVDLLNSLATRASIELERKELDEQLRLSARVFSDTHEGIVITDVEGTIVDVNPTFCEVTEYSREEIIGQNPRLLNSGKQGPEFYADMWQTLATDGHWQGEVWNRKKGGELYAELLSVSTLTDENNDVINYVGIFTDITNSKRQQEQLEFMAHYDVLTKLPNRILFADRFNQAMAHSKRTETLLAVAFLDLDNFKPVNDNYGHIIGDQLLVEVAKRIQTNIREEDTVSRQGGDEFAFFLVDLDSPFQGEQMLSRIQQSLAQPYLIEGHTISISASMGVTLYPNDDADLDTLLRHADQAMYQSKVKGKNNFHIFDIEDNQKAVHEHHRLHEIETALHNGELTLYYQPKVNMRTGKVFGVEALIRWQHPEKGLIPPMAFLPILEGQELEIAVGNWVIEQALQQLEEWKRQGIDLEISINISSAHLLNKTFFTHLDSVLSRHQTVDSKQLQMEILESSVLADIDAIQNCIKVCQYKYGIQFALDDFGTGYSSLTHIRSLPADTIKIDQSFIINMLDDPNDYTIVDGILALAESFGREIIAEGVETTEHGLMLLVMGCENAQGYGIAKPMPANEVSDWLDNYAANPRWLSFNPYTHTPAQRRVKLLRLFLEQWLKRFIDHTGSGDHKEYWEGHTHEKCHCSYWIKHQRKERLFSQHWLDKLQDAHEKLHHLAQAVIHNQAEVTSSSETSNLDDIHHSINHIFDILGEFNNGEELEPRCA